MEPDLRERLNTAVTNICDGMRKAGIFHTEEAVNSVFDGLSRDTLAALAEEGSKIIIRQNVRTAMRRDVRVANSETGWLPGFDDYQTLPHFIEIEGGSYIDIRNATLEEYRVAKEKLEKRVDAFRYPRRTQAKKKRDEKALREMRKLEGEVSDYFAGNPKMTMGLALDRHREKLESIATAQRRAANRARWARTKNQQLPGKKK